MSINSAVVMEGNREVLPLNSLEKTKLILENISATIEAGSGYPGNTCVYQATGRLTCTNYRLVFVTVPSQEKFDSFMATWNKIDPGTICQGHFLGLFPISTWYFQTTIDPLDGEEHLKCKTRLTVQLGSAQDADQLRDLVENSRWTGHIDPENTAEPPPPYCP